MDYGLYRKGSSLGEKRDTDHPIHGKLIDVFQDPVKASEKAKRMNDQLSPGEKQYYGMKYHVKSMEMSGEEEHNSDDNHGMVGMSQNKGLTGMFNKIWALFHKAGVPKEEIEAAKIEAEKEIQQNNVDFSKTAEFSYLQNENVKLKKQLEEQQTLTATFSANFKNQEKIAQFNLDCSEIDKLSSLPFARITPAQADKYRKMAEESPETFAKVLPIIRESPILAQFDRSSVARYDADSNDPGEKLTKLTKERVDKTKEDYVAAFSQVCRENPELAMAHNVNMTGGN